MSLRYLIICVTIPLLLPSFAEAADKFPKEFASEINSRKLNLSSANDFTQFFYTVEIHVTRDGKRVKACDMLVSQVNRKRAVLVRYADGLPYCFLTDNLFIIRDAKAGIFRVFNQEGAVNFEVKFNRGTGAEISLGIKPHAASPKISFDARSFIDDPEVNGATFDVGTKTALWKIGAHDSPTEVQATVKLELNMDPSAPYPIQTLTFDSPKAPLLVLSHFLINKPAPIDLHVAILDKLKSANLEIRSLNKEDIKAVPIFPTFSRLEAQNERDVAERWFGFFQPAKNRNK